MVHPTMVFGDSLVPPNKCQFLQETILKLNAVYPTGSFCEVGVYKGGTAKVIAQTIKPTDPLYLFDTFDGIPNQCEFDNLCIIGDFSDAPYDDIVNYFNNFENVHVHKGYFPKDTGTFIENETFKFVHLDVDTYISYKECLEFFYNKMMPGGCIVFDDYGSIHCLGATQAVNEFFSDKVENVSELNSNFYIIKA